MAELVAPEDLPKYVPGRVTAKSDGLDWNGVALRSYAYRGQDVEVPAMRDFMLVRYQTGVTPMERRFDGRWTKTTCGPGAVSLLTRSQVSHWHWTENVHVTHVYLSPDLVSAVAEEVTGRKIEGVALADILRAEDPVLNSAIDAIHAEATEQALGSSLYIEAVSRQLVLHLLRRYSSVTVRPDNKTGEFSCAERKRIQDFIHRNLAEKLTLTDIAAVVNMAPRTFSRYFFRSFSLQPYAYIQRARVEKARDLLKSSRCCIKEIAHACGFSDQAHLSRQFTGAFGRSPAVYRSGL